MQKENMEDVKIAHNIEWKYVENQNLKMLSCNQIS